MVDSFVYRNLSGLLTRENLQFEEFKNLTRTHMDDMTEEQVGKMKRIREDVPPITRDTVVTKVMPYEYLEGLTSGTHSKIGSFIARQVDTGHLQNQNLKQTIETYALDYDKSLFVDALKRGEDRYLLFEGKLVTPNQSVIPYGEKFGGNVKDGLPCTLNGFIGCHSNDILPEFKDEIGQYPKKGSTITLIENGERVKQWEFDDKENTFLI
ncbi:hypothetical protein BWD09_12725, partial [Neisseria dentiae]